MQSADNRPVVVAAAAAVAIGLVVLGRNVVLWRRDDESLRERVHELQERVSELLTEQQALWASQSVIFTVAQYNILASYLGDNRQPWFLYGLPAGAMPDSRREAIMTKFYERDQQGKLVNVGWPNFVRGLLSDEEQRQIEACNERYFVWDVRRTKLLDTVLGTGADLISLVELDLYESFWQPNMHTHGYDSVYRKRPRATSRDGCGIFWRRKLFTLEAQDHLDFVDRHDSETGQTSKDRCALFVLLRHVHSGERVLFISTHLARNPEDFAQTKMRAKQAQVACKAGRPAARPPEPAAAPIPAPAPYSDPRRPSPRPNLHAGGGALPEADALRSAARRAQRAGHARRGPQHHQHPADR